MNDIATIIETLEHRWMRAWIGRDRKTLKRLTSKEFRLLIASKPDVLLDAPSWVETSFDGFTCQFYRFGDTYARIHGSTAIFTCRIDLEAQLDRADWSGEMAVTDIWRKARFRRSWQLVEKIISRPESGEQIAPAIRSLQLWRR